MSIIKKFTNNKCCQECGEKETLGYHWLECKLVQPFRKIVWRFFKKLKVEQPCMHAKLLQWCPTLRDPMDHSLPGSSAHGILQVRKLEWFVMPSSRGSSQPRYWIWVSLCLLHWQAGSLSLAPPGKPRTTIWPSNSIPRYIC